MKLAMKFLKHLPRGLKHLKTASLVSPASVASIGEGMTKMVIKDPEVRRVTPLKFKSR
jgi:hypothetical protein